MKIKTPPGTVPLIYKQNSKQLRLLCAGCDPDVEWFVRCEFCVDAGFRVVDAEKFDAWLRSQTIRPNMHHIEYEPVDLFDAEYE